MRPAGGGNLLFGLTYWSGSMMLRWLGWGEAADTVETALAATITDKRVTHDLARQMKGATEVKTSEFGKAIVSNL